MEAGQVKFLVNTEKYLVAKVKILEVTDTHIKNQTFAHGEDLNPLVLPVPIDKAEKIMFDDYNEAKAELGAYIAKQHTLGGDTIITSANYNIIMDRPTALKYIHFTREYFPEKLV